MTDKHKTLTLSIAVLSISLCTAVSLTLYLLYSTAIKEEMERLTETVQSHARLIEAVSRFDKQHSDDYPKGPFEATLSQIREAHANYKGFGVTGEFTLAKLVDGEIVFLLRHKYMDTSTPRPVPINTPLAEPMRLALSGQSGVIVGLDYRGEKVLASFEPIKEMGLGLVAKIDFTEIRKPFYRTAGIVGCITLLIVLISVYILLRFNPFLNKLEEERLRVRNYLDVAGIMILALDSKGQITLINRKGCEVLEASAEQIVGLSWFEKFVLKDEQKNVFSAFQELMAGKIENIEFFENKIISMNGTVKLIFWTNRMLRDKQGQITGILSSGEDITARRNFETMLEESNKELDDFAYIASHDLKEPLRGIMNYSNFLLEDYGEQFDEDGRSKLNTLVFLGQRLSDFISSLLTFSRVGRLEYAYQETDLNAVVEDVISSIQVSLNEENIVVRMPQTLPTILCDKIRMREVFLNLISNAMKYNDKPEKWIEIGTQEAESEGGGMVFYVRDNGIGIREKHIDKVFMIFKRLHGRDKYGGGTGAGLTIVKKIIEKHGGSIWLKSTFGEGTTFYFTLGRIYR